MSSSAPPTAAPHEAPAPPPDAHRSGGARAVLAIYAAAVFSSAFLLFLVQPMFSKMVLPLLGGTPAVWNTCMLFFQAALLGGYLYAHVGATRLSVRAQAILHLALLAVAAVALPIGVGAAAPEGGAAPIPWLLLLMATTVGLPFFVLSGTGPMLQRWFAHTGHPGAANPYWLYAASNLGSMLALLGYPALMEPRLRLAEQSMAWAAGYAALFALVAGCALALLRGRGAATASADSAGASSGAGARVTGRERLVWIALAFLPSSLLLSVTTFITTDLAPVPLLWVLPLALYLLTFTLAFAARPPIRHQWMVWVQPAVLTIVALLLMYGLFRTPRLVIPLHLGALFVTAMVCHGELARRRPPVRHLTEFYLWISVGGVLGGIFNVLVAPVIFTRTWEYPLVLALACLARPWAPGLGSRRAMLHYGLRTLGFVLALLLLVRPENAIFPPAVRWALTGVVVVLVAAGLGRAPAWLALCLGTALGVSIVRGLANDNAILAERSFYGRYTVVRSDMGDGFHALYHGSTLHGAQSTAPDRRRQPLSYYLMDGPFGHVLESTDDRAGRRRVAVVGLGTGTAAAYAAPGDRWTFYEIDPGIVRVARDPRYFTYLADSRAPVDVVLGDARLSMAGAPVGAYDLIILDAFSSDAIPVHLLTREALGMYLEKLAAGGMIMFHLSNRYLNLEPVLGALAKERGLSIRVSEHRPARENFNSASTWAVVARSEEDLGPLATDMFWRGAEIDPGVRPWTDDFSSLLAVFGK
ncbi:MAG TPA: fused MFS/spermidine synthase [Longimicrobium sp.]|nr:fused MFS/spermidine synthase [Longimicrobium sp.]